MPVTDERCKHNPQQSGALTRRSDDGTPMTATEPYRRRAMTVSCRNIARHACLTFADFAAILFDVMDFFFLRQNLFGDATGIEIEGHTEASAKFQWTAGVRFPKPFPCETFKLNDAYGRNYPDFFDTSVPVMSQRLVEQLRASGVSNIDAYPVVLHDARNQHQRTDYVAVNVVGCVNAVDFEKTSHEIRRGKPKLNGTIAIDERLTNGLLACRMP